MNPFQNQPQQPAQQPSQPAASAGGGDEFDIIARAQVWGEGIKMNPEHNYLLVLQGFSSNISTQNRAMTNYVFEFLVEQSDDPMLDGKTVSHVEHSTSQGFDSRILKIFMFLWGMDANDAEQVEKARPHLAQVMRDAKATGASNGRKIVAQTQARRKAKNNFDFMPIKWSAAA